MVRSFHLCTPVNLVDLHSMSRVHSTLLNRCLCRDSTWLKYVYLARMYFLVKRKQTSWAYDKRKELVLCENNR